MAKIRHIAIRSENPEGTASFFREVFGLELIQRREHGPIDLSDGDINLTILPLNLGPSTYEVLPGFEHIGFSSEEPEAIHQRLMEHGAKEMNPVALGDVYFESKYRTEEGLIIDVGHWRGAKAVGQPAHAGAKP
ncbi:MAG: VOC family protein [Chloroflexota bacterium]|nr:VOC family protein [Chloroflexota bacterium]